jgi:hypothetical protein
MAPQAAIRVDYYSMLTFTCQCGGKIVGPPPPNCPHCGARIKRVRQRANPWPVVIIAILFAALLGIVFLLTRAPASL